MYLVTGAAGNVGSEVVRALWAGDHPVRAVVRDPRAARLPAGTEIVTGDLDAAETLLPLLNGVEGIFLLPGYTGAAGLLDAAKRAGVARVVQLSGGSAGSRDMSNAVTAMMAGAEQLVAASGLPATVLRPASFMSNTFRWLPQLRAGDELRLQFAGVRTAVIDPADIGAVAAVALVDDAHAGRTYTLSGPQSLSAIEQVEILAAELSRPLRVVALSDEESYAEMLTQMPAAYADAFMNFYGHGGLDESAVLPAVFDITGREPGDYTNWVRANKAALTPSPN
ncbi:NmrA family NAD(P)-binding protein [Nocardia sp. NPDC059240]|uniref:NAD(P)H-binding protein n=1 Tax=Nocardia sp. NPDC059240 TaxID=3346786 RepID=UPI0036C7AA69